MNSISATPYVEQHSHWVIEVPIRIVSIIVVALIVRLLLRRMINRLIRPVTADGVPRILRHFRERAESNKVLASALLSERRAQRARTIASVLNSTISFVIVVIVVLLILSELEIDLAPFIAGTSIVGVALGFGAQNLVKDFLAGMFIMMEDQFGVGDEIDVDQTSGRPALGTVEAVGLRSTRLRGADGVVYYLRNGELIKIGNRSQ